MYTVEKKGIKKKKKTADRMNESRFVKSSRGDSI